VNGSEVRRHSLRLTIEGNTTVAAVFERMMCELRVYSNVTGPGRW